MIVYWDDPVTAMLVLLHGFVPALLPMVPCLALALWARRRVARARAATGSDSGVSGEELAATILAAGGATDRRIVVGDRAPSDLYDPFSWEVRLSRKVASGRSPWALAVAARESGFALKDSRGDRLARLRPPVVLGARIGLGAAWLIVLGGLILLQPGLCCRGGLMFSGSVMAMLAFVPSARAMTRTSLAVLGDEPTGEAMRTDPTLGRAMAAAAWADVASAVPSLPSWSRAR